MQALRGGRGNNLSRTGGKGFRSWARNIGWGGEGENKTPQQPMRGVSGSELPYIRVGRRGRRLMGQGGGGRGEGGQEHT